MLKSKEVEVSWNSSNRKHYESKGYIFTKKGDKFIIPVNNLPNKSFIKVEVQCDYCGIKFPREWEVFLRLKNNYVSKDACLDCASLKRMEIKQYEIDNNLINDRNIYGYWRIKDNVLNELNIFILNNGYIGSINGDTEWKKIRRGLNYVNISIEDAVSNLGYNINKLQIRKPNNYYDTFEKLEKDIRVFIDKNKRFPTQLELAKELGIYANSYQKYGNLDEIKIKMNYCDNEDLISNDGYLNKSYYELITANFLLAQGLSFKREQYIFKQFNKKSRYKSDFTFYLDNDKIIHCEVWGGYKNTSSKYYNYDKDMKKKIELYNKYNIRYISVYPNIFHNSTKNIQKSLYNIFKPYLNLKYKKIDNKLLLSSRQLKKITDEDLFNELLKYSDDKRYLPSTAHLRRIGKEHIYVEVLKRYDNYIDFANKFNKSLLHVNNNYWTKDKIFERFDYMIDNYGKILSSVEMMKLNNIDTNIRNVIDRIYSFGSLADMKLEYFKNKIDNNNNYIITDKDKRYLFLLSKGSDSRVNKEQQKQAKEILDKYNELQLITIN